MTNEDMTRKQGDLLRLAESRSPMSIYQLAKAAKRPYRRVYDHVHALAAADKVSLKEVVRNNRRATLVISNNIYYQRLLHLDEMYAAHHELCTGQKV